MWQEFIIRQGDRLPALSVLIEDDLGNPLNVDPALYKATFRFVHQRLGVTIQRGGLIVNTGGQTAVTYDWQRRDWGDFSIGVYDVLVELALATGGGGPVLDRIDAPSTRDALLIVRPYAPVDLGTYWDDADNVWDDPLVTWEEEQDA